MPHAAIIVKSDNNPAFNSIRNYLLESHVDFEVLHFDEDAMVEVEHYERREKDGEFHMVRVHERGQETFAHD